MGDPGLVNFYAVANGNTCQGVISKCPIVDGGNGWGYDNAGKPVIRKCLCADFGNARTNGYAGQVIVIKCLSPDVNNAVGDVNAG